jgi:hypothetical protein
MDELWRADNVRCQGLKLFERRRQIVHKQAISRLNMHSKDRYWMTMDWRKMSRFLYAHTVEHNARYCMFMLIIA